MNKSVILSCLILFIVITNSIAQDILPSKSEIIKHKISEVIVFKYNVINKKRTKTYVDTMKYDIGGNLSEKRIKAYDTNSENKWSGDWNYTYDSLGNRLLETRKSVKQRVMDYFIYVYDSSHVQKKIWNYWVNLKLQFSRIYEMQYDTKGRLKIELVENGAGHIDSVYSFQYDLSNRLLKTICTSDKEQKDTINTISYSYYKNSRLSKKITQGKFESKLEEYTGCESQTLTQTLVTKETTNYNYDSPKMVETIYTFKYLYR